MRERDHRAHQRESEKGVQGIALEQRLDVPIGALSYELNPGCPKRLNFLGQVLWLEIGDAPQVIGVVECVQALAYFVVVLGPEDFLLNKLEHFVVCQVLAWYPHFHRIEIGCLELDWYDGSAVLAIPSAVFIKDLEDRVHRYLVAAGNLCHSQAREVARGVWGQQGHYWNAVGLLQADCRRHPFGRVHGLSGHLHLPPITFMQ